MKNIPAVLTARKIMRCCGRWSKRPLWRGFLAIVGGFIVHLTLGTMYTSGNITPYIISYVRYHGEKTIRAEDGIWVFNLMALGQGAAMVFGGMLEQRIGPRISALISCSLMSLGILFTYFSVQQSYGLTLFTYGIVFGLGMGASYVVPLACGMRWFPEQKGFVSGVILAAFGGGSFIFNQVQTAFVNPDNYSPELVIDGDLYFDQPDMLQNVPSLFLLLGGCYLTMQVIGCMMLGNPPEYNLKIHDEENKYVQLEEDSEVRDDSNKNDIVKYETAQKECHIDVHDQPQLRPSEMIRTKHFYMLWVIFALNLNAVNFISGLYKTYGQTFIVDDEFLAIVGSLSALFNFLGRLFWGHLADRHSFKLAMTLLNGTFTVLMLTLALTEYGGQWMFLVWICLIFGTFSGTFSLMAIATAKCFGMRYYSTNYGLVFTANLISSPIGAFLTSELKSTIGWYGMFFLTSGLMFISHIMAMLFDKKVSGKDV